MLQCGVDLLLTEARGHGDGGLELQQLGQQSAACRCGLFSRRNRDGHTTHGGSSRQLQGPVLLDFGGEGEGSHRA